METYGLGWQELILRGLQPRTMYCKKPLRRHSNINNVPRYRGRPDIAVYISVPRQEVCADTVVLILNGIRLI